MTKIKNFRIQLRTRDMARWLKKERGLETTPELEVSVEQAGKEAKRWIEPAAVYTTLTRQIAEKTTTISFPDKAIAISIVAVSIGPALEAERKSAEAGSSTETLLAAVQQEALAQALQFAIRLVQDQAKEEDCEMSAPVFSPDLFTSSTLPTLLGVQRIGIAFDASTQELPSHARVAWLFWTPVGKSSSRQAGAPNRKAGSEKVAA
jgi:hypothetical protein